MQPPRRWYSYPDRQLMEVEGHTLRVVTEAGTEEYDIRTYGITRTVSELDRTYGITRTVSELDRNYATTRKPGRRPRWLVSAENRADFNSHRLLPDEVIRTECFDD